MFYHKEGGELGIHSALMKMVFSQFGWWGGNVESTALNTDWKRDWVFEYNVTLKNRNSCPHQLMYWWTMCIY